MLLGSRRPLVYRATTFPTTPTLDNFNRTENPLASPWGPTLNGGNKLKANGASALAAGPVSGSQVYMTNLGPAFEVWHTRGNGIADNYLCFCIQPGTEGGSGILDCYILHEQPFNGWNIGVYVNDVGTTQLISGQCTNNTGDQFGVRVEVTGRMTAYLNGIPLGSVVDTTYQSGYVGLATSSQTDGFDAFGGGTISG